MTHARRWWVHLAVLAAGIALVGAPDHASAQRFSVALLPAPGSRVRAEYRTSTVPVSVEGVLLSGTSAGFSLDTDQGQREIPADLLMSLQVSDGRSRGRGFLMGLGSGLAIGALVMGVYTGIAYDDNDASGCFIACSRGEAITLGAVVGAIVGAPTGAVVGLVAAPRRWERVW
jgi:hypothetical protein